jgi:hypothetical protein
MTVVSRRLLCGSLTFAAVAPLGLVACGGDSNNVASAPPAAPPTTAHPDTTRAPAATDAPTTEAPPTTAASTTSSSPKSSSSSSSTSTTAGGGTPNITIQSFSITPSPIPCDANQKGLATMAWSVVPTSVAVSFLVDGAGAGPDQIGTMTNAALPPYFKCDGQSHKVTIVASNQSGTVRKDLVVTTQPSSSGTGP